MSKVRVGIINVTGYASIELARLLYLHPEVELISATGWCAARRKVVRGFDHLSGEDSQAVGWVSPTN